MTPEPAGMPAVTLPPFPPGFVFGVATSAYQIEGAAAEDGKGPSIWDRFCREPGAIADGSTGDVACDHYHRLDEDLDLIASLGVDAYRFSVSWPRVQPAGEGAWNEAGLAFYDRLVDGLRARGIRPYLTLNHWDLPAALQDRGGWAARRTVQCFVDYALGVHRRLGDRVDAITTHNEPWVIAMLGHDSGIFAPGLKHRGTALQVAHHLLLSHGLAVRALRGAGSRAALGIVLNLAPVHPATDAQADRARARIEDGLLARWYLDPLFGRGYPADAWSHVGADAPRVEPGDLQAIAEPMDFLGINYYSRCMVSAQGAWDVKQGGLPLTDMGWEVYPRGLTELLLRLRADYPALPLFVMENGAAYPDTVEHGRVHDARRLDYIAAHLAALREAMDAGVPVAGYMVWSLLDNFEWASGQAKRFGLVHVDYATGQRTPKDSALWFREMLLRRRAALAGTGTGAAMPAREAA